jgi:peptide/nickel transport system permease protein
VGLLVFATIALLLRFLRRNPSGFPRGTPSNSGSTLAALMCLCLVAGILWQLAPVYHVLGTDKVGNDVLYQSLKSVRTALVLGTVSTLITLPLAIGLGLAAGYFGGWVDDCVQYTYAVVSSVPSVLLIAAGALALDLWLEAGAGVEMFGNLAASSDFRLLCLCVVLGLTGWTGLCRLVRGEVLKLRSSEFTLASRGLGMPSWRIILRHLLPNVMPLVLVVTVLDFSALVLAEAVLTYINIGIDPATPSWGNMINAARLELTREPVVWWSLAAAFLGMLGLVLPVNLLADVIRDEFDPRSRSQESQS